MSYFSDPKIRFYLRHQEKIDQWAEIQRDVYLETKSFLGSLVDDIETMATDLEHEPHVVAASALRGLDWHAGRHSAALDGPVNSVDP